MYEIIYDNVEETEVDNSIIEETIKKCFEEEKILEANLEVSITITNGQMIRQINNEHRGIDKQTDVLSFPMFEKDELDQKISEMNYEVFDVLR